MPPIASSSKIDPTPVIASSAAAAPPVESIVPSPPIYERENAALGKGVIISPPGPREKKITPPSSPIYIPSVFPTHSIDQAVAGLSAGIVSTLCMHPLDLIKVKFQVETGSPQSGSGVLAAIKGKGKEVLVRSGVGKEMWNSLRDIAQRDGVRGLYRGLTPNLVGNASSWGLYFLWYTMLKDRMNGGDSTVKLSPGQHLLASAESGLLTAILTNPIWVVKTRMFTTTADAPTAYRNAFHGLIQLGKQEGLPGLTKGMGLALFGVSNGAIQFMAYEELKRWRVDSRRARLGPGTSEEEAKKLSNTEYIIMSGSAKLVAIGITYPYQVVRSRIQYKSPTLPPYTSIPNCISRTFANEGLRGFYKGLAPNAVRILPGTCVTFVVYEQLSRLFEKHGN